MNQEHIKEPEMAGNRELVISFFSLFGSFSTLICCALPALLVTLGMGATVVGLTSTFPWLITLSHYKNWLFSGSFIILSASAIMLYRARHAPCPIDPVKRRACQIGRKASIISTILSFSLWTVGALVAYAPGVIFFFAN